MKAHRPFDPRASVTGQLFRRVTALLVAIMLTVFGLMFWTAGEEIDKVYDLFMEQILSDEE